MRGPGLELFGTGWWRPGMLMGRRATVFARAVTSRRWRRHGGGPDQPPAPGDGPSRPRPAPAPRGEARAATGGDRAGDPRRRTWTIRVRPCRPWPPPGRSWNTGWWSEHLSGSNHHVRVQGAAADNSRLVRSNPSRNPRAGIDWQLASMAGNKRRRSSWWWSGTAWATLRACTGAVRARPVRPHQD